MFKLFILLWVHTWTIWVEFDSSSSIIIDIVDADQGQPVHIFPKSPVWNCESSTKRMKMDQPSYYSMLVQICQMCVHRGVKKKVKLANFLRSYKYLFASLIRVI